MAKGLTIDVTADTNNLSAKLRAISKHTLALAEELDEIDKAKCPNCGNVMEKTVMYADSFKYSSVYKCDGCGVSMGVDLAKEV